jgi:uncharacterized protein YndB with AHSA1/START domain
MAASNGNDRELVFTRVFDAPRELVFEAWTKQEHVGQWFGPNGFTTTTHEMNVTPGGTWRYIMHGPDGTDYPNVVKYREVVRPERLVYWHGGEGIDGFDVTVLFEDEAGKTRLTMRMTFPTKEEKDRVVEQFGAIEGAHQTLGRLEAYLRSLRG